MENEASTLGLNETIISAKTQYNQLIIGCVPPEPGPDFFCGTCPFEGTFGEVANHHITNHDQNSAKFSQKGSIIRLWW